MTLRLLALLAVAVVSAVLPAAAPAQDNVLNVGKYGQLATYDPHAGALDSSGGPSTTSTSRCGPGRRHHRAAPGAGDGVADVARRQDLDVHAARAA